MSLMDKIKSMFSGGSDDHDHDHAGSHHPHEDLAGGDVPPAPVDPIGTPAATPPPADRDQQL